MKVMLSTRDPGFEAAFRALLAAKRESAADVHAAVATIIENVVRRGDDALIDYTRRFDGVGLSARDLRLTKEQIMARMPHNLKTLEHLLEANGKDFRLTEPIVPRAFRERMRQTACARFKTVLGPGSDGYHEDHVHLDLAERHNDYRMCQWDVREPGQAVDIPLPRPRPFEAAAGDQKP